MVCQYAKKEVNKIGKKYIRCELDGSLHKTCKDCPHMKPRWIWKFILKMFKEGR